MQQEKKIEYKKRKIPVNQKIWNFMRRNPVFCISDLMIILDVKGLYFQNYIKKLENAKYIVFVGKRQRPHSAREYKLINNTGVTAPSIINNKLYDFNVTDDDSPYYYEKSGKRQSPKNLELILEAMKKEEMTLKEVAIFSGIKETEISYWWAKLKDLKIILGAVLNEDISWRNRNKYKTINRARVYAFNLEKKEVLLTRLKKGSYVRFSEVRHLWEKL